MVYNSAKILKSLRCLLKDPKYVTEATQAYFIPLFDAHHNEYLAPCHQRRAFISGFHGSYGSAIITEHHACLWTDGRYFVQAQREIDDNWTLMKEGIPSTPSEAEWLGKTLPAGARVGVDPMLVTQTQWESLSKKLENYGQELVAINTNLVDLVWEERPPEPQNMIVPLEIRYSGRTWKSKVREVIRRLAEKRASTLIVTALDEIAWLLNLRGSDIPFNPVFFAWATVSLDGTVHLFTQFSKITVCVRQHLGLELGPMTENGTEDSEGEALPEVSVNLRSYEEIEDFLREQVFSTNRGKFWLSSNCNRAIANIIPADRRLTEVSPIALMKLVKNPVELEGMINAHVKDAAALCEFFSWLEKNVDHGLVTEMSASEKATEFRESYDDFVGLSFETIAGSGPNGAVIHYKPCPETDRKVTREDMFLLDSGAQYKDGTTDVTRTVHLGVPSDYQKECFTRVLKGHIAIRTAKFPVKLKGNHLDSLARKALWDVGLDYMHGTGHGVGHYLNVHEGPIYITWRDSPDDPGFEAGMVVSNEPGFYEDGKFGIRIENLVYTTPVGTKYKFAPREFLTFADLTLVPIQTSMIEPSLLTSSEIDYIHSYHNLCRDKVGPLLKSLNKQDALKWLLRETQTIG